MKSPTLALRITGALAASGLPPDRLEIEITEAVLIHDDETALAILHQLRAIGVRIALDDFGTGFSSLSYLKRFPFDKIKIDRCFVSDIEVDGSAAIVQAVVNIAAARNMTTTAEGVETEQQREMLRQLGCTEMQGYLFSAPKPAAEARRLLGARLEDGDSRRLTPFQRAGVEDGCYRRTAPRLQRRDGLLGPEVGRVKDFRVAIEIRHVDPDRRAAAASPYRTARPATYRSADAPRGFATAR